MDMEKLLPTSNSFEKEPISFIIFLRVVAVFLILWAHIAGWLDAWNVSWLPLDLFRKYVTVPLGIIQDCGFIGVALLFLISGFIITYVAQVESRKEFAIKRFFRIYPPLIFSIILIIVFFLIYSYVTQLHVYIQDFNAFEIFTSFTLANYFFTPQFVINAVAWILVVLVLFYISCFIILPMLKKHPKTSVGILIVFTILTITLSKSFGGVFFLFAVSVSYFPYLILGQILYYWWTRRISTLEGIVFSLLAYLVSVQGLLMVNSDFYSVANSYGISFVYAYLIFLVTLLISEKIRVGQIFGFYSKISYSFFLNNGVGMEFISIFFPLIGFFPSLIIALTVLTIISYLFWRFVEMPFRKFSRRIVNYLKTK